MDEAEFMRRTLAEAPRHLFTGASTAEGIASAATFVVGLGTLAAGIAWSVSEASRGAPWLAACGALLIIAPTLLRSAWAAHRSAFTIGIRTKSPALVKAETNGGKLLHLSVLVNGLTIDNPSSVGLALDIRAFVRFSGTSTFVEFELEDHEKYEVAAVGDRVSAFPLMVPAASPVTARIAFSAPDQTRWTLNEESHNGAIEVVQLRISSLGSSEFVPQIIELRPELLSARL